MRRGVYTVAACLVLVGVLWLAWEGGGNHGIQGPYSAGKATKGKWHGKGFEQGIAKKATPNTQQPTSNSGDLVSAGSGFGGEVLGCDGGGEGCHRNHRGHREGF